METAQARLSLQVSKYHIVGNHISRLICLIQHFEADLLMNNNLTFI